MEPSYKSTKIEVVFDGGLLVSVFSILRRLDRKFYWRTNDKSYIVICYVVSTEDFSEKTSV